MSVQLLHYYFHTSLIILTLFCGVILEVSKLAVDMHDHTEIYQVG